MVEKILKETYVNPKIELTQSDYNRLVELARMKAKKIEERARALYEKEGVVKIQFDGRIEEQNYRYDDSVRHYYFDCNVADYRISPNSEYGDKTIFTIPQEERQRIAKKVGRYVEEVFDSKFGDHLAKLNEIEKIKNKETRIYRMFIIFTAIGWIAAVTMLLVAILL